MKQATTSIDGVLVVEIKRFRDHRGGFSRLFCETDLATVLGERHIVQINHSRTSQVGAIRGMHYQHAPHAEMKMIRCMKGKVWDVAVDLRKKSPTFLQWYGLELSENNNLMMVIPEGCAHGFQVLESDSELLYLHTATYTPTLEAGVRYNDPALGITWPIRVSEFSDRDKGHPLLTKQFSGVNL